MTARTMSQPTKKLLYFLFLTGFAFSVFGQNEQKGEMHIPILNGTRNPVEITVAILDGSTPEQKLFLKELAVTSKKATFIANNLQRQGFQTRTYSSPDIDWTITSTNWPQMETVVLCGKITLYEQVNGYNVENKYSFAGWGSAQLQPNMRLQGTLAGLSFTDYCPPNTSSFGANTETTIPHPEPSDQIAVIQRAEQQQRNQLSRQFLGTWKPASPGYFSGDEEKNWKPLECTGDLKIGITDWGALTGKGAIHYTTITKRGVAKYDKRIYNFQIDSVLVNNQGAPAGFQGNFNFEWHYRKGLIFDSDHTYDSYSTSSATIVNLKKDAITLRLDCNNGSDGMLVLRKVAD